VKFRFQRFIALILLVGVFIFIFMKNTGSAGDSEKLIFSDFAAAVRNGEVASIEVKGNEITGEFTVRGMETHNGQKSFESYGSINDDLRDVMDENKVAYKFSELDDSSWTQMLIYMLPTAILIFFMLYMFSQMQGGGKGMSFGKSKARLLTQDQHTVTFADVAGIEEAKEELREIVEFLKTPRRFTRLGGRIPKGVLLMGPPGTGKTLLARSVAGEAKVPFFTISGSDFVEMFVGVGASRVRDLFEQGKKNAPCIIFIDEIDAVGRHRGAGLGGGHDEREQTLNQLLVEMDGFESNDGVILIAATNRPDVLDPALLRPGRFDRRVTVPSPDVRGREAILKVHTKRTPLGKTVDLEIIAKATPGMSGADIENLVNEAALNAAQNNADCLEQSDFTEARDKLLMGRERRSMVITEKEKRGTAFHEAGHALVTKLLPGDEVDPIHKITIVPRGRALGMVAQVPDEDKLSYSREWLLNRIAITMGGRVADELIFGVQNTGASNDLENATKIARKMVAEWGMSDAFGPVAYVNPEEQPFLGMELSHAKNYSERTAQLLDDEVRRILTQQYERAKKILGENLDKLNEVAEALIEFETIDGDEFELILDEGREALAQKRKREKEEELANKERVVKVNFNSKIREMVEEEIEENKEELPPIELA
jgi:cell division protease FtsH